MTQVITSEGNAAFYEGGCMESPLSQGYSILGWNTPGFGCSTGMPYPDQVHNGIDAVVQYALEELGFPESQVVFFSWSIGGFAASWAAANYPGCKALVSVTCFCNSAINGPWLSLHHVLLRPVDWSISATKVICDSLQMFKIEK